MLVTGGAGYIGSHTVARLRDRGDHVVVVDDLSSGHVGRIPDVRVVVADLADPHTSEVVTAVLREERIDAVVHFAARKRVGESVERPAWYYAQNVGGLATLLQAVRDAGVRRFVFSSSAAVYAPGDGPVSEGDTTAPVNPYGETKLVGELMLEAEATAAGLSATSLRYFNVGGADSTALRDLEATNLIPIVIECLREGRPAVVFGDDYATPDGTGVRDYVHVADVADAHLAALDALDPAGDGRHRVYNIGTGAGLSVREVIAAVAHEMGRAPQELVAPRRAGDAAAVVADVSRVSVELGWTARFDARAVIASACETAGV